MLITVCGANNEDRQGIKTLIELYAKECKKDIRIEEYSSGIEMCRDIKRLRELEKKKHNLLFSFVEGERELETGNIIYIETDRHKNIFHTTDENGTYSLYKKLDELEAELEQYGFVRIHKSFLVNMKYVEKISSYILRLTTGQELSVPKSRYPTVRKKYADYSETKSIRKS